MPTLPPEIIPLLSVFSSAFSRPVWKNAVILLTGAILLRGQRQVTKILCVMGLGHTKNFGKFHRVLNRAKWNSVYLSKILFGLLIALLPTTAPIVIAADETLERRKGKKITAKGCYRDAVRSSESNVVKAFGLKWECFALIVVLPFSSRPWALPFMTVLAPSKKANEARGRLHKTSIDWTIVMIKLVCRWLKNRSWVLLGDGAYACLDLAQSCIERNVTLVSRLRLDAQLFHFPENETKFKRGRKRVKGQRIKLKNIIDSATTSWHEAEVPWYGGKKKKCKFFSDTCLWYQAGKKPVPLRYVIVFDPDGDYRTEVFFTTALDMAPEKIIYYFVLRWNIEVTFEEVRAHLGVETQRQWSDRAIARTTPLLMGLFSIVTLMGIKLQECYKLTPLSSSWYQKGDEVTFSDLIAFVRRAIWGHKYFSKSAFQADSVKLDRCEINLLINQLAGSG